MDKKEGDELRKRWFGRECSHPEVEPERYLGAHTGDYVCTRCGKTGTDSNLSEPKWEDTGEAGANEKSKP
jgi:hypothetical protein